MKKETVTWNLIEKLTDRLFWDTDKNTLDAVLHARYIIPRVMDYGAKEDVVAVQEYYEPEFIKEVLLSVPYLDDRTIHYFAYEFNVKPEDFRAYRKKRETNTWNR